MFGKERGRAYGSLSLACIEIEAIHCPNWIRALQQNKQSIRLCPACNGSGESGHRSLDLLHAAFSNTTRICKVCNGHRFLLCGEEEVTATDIEAIELSFKRAEWLIALAHRNASPALCLDCNATLGPFSNSLTGKKTVGGCRKCGGMGFLKDVLIKSM